MRYDEQSRMIARLTFVLCVLPIVCFGRDVKAAPVDEVCAGYADTAAGAVASRRCRAVVGKHVNGWVRIIPLRGEVDYDRLCTPPKESPNASSTPEYIDCLGYAGRTVMLVRGLR